MSDTPLCPCDGFLHPRLIMNLPGQNTLDYRVGDYLSFRHALLLPCAGETELALWRPGADGDLAVQLVEWWAYLADILTFYNERILNQCALRTADQPESVARLVRLLGYRPRPGIGAVGTVAALIDGKRPVTLQKGFPIQSKPGPGRHPQIFELDADTTFTLPDALPVFPEPDDALLDSTGAMRLKGTITTLKQGETLLLLSRAWSGATEGYAVVTVQSTRLETDPYGGAMTRVSFANPIPLVGIPADAKAQDYRLLRSSQFAQVWHFDDAGTAHFGSLLRSLQIGDFVLLSGSPLHLSAIQSMREVVAYRDTAGNYFSTSPDATNTPPFPVFHTKIGFQPTLSGKIEDNSVTAWYEWREVGNLIGTPRQSVLGDKILLNAAPSTLFPAGDSLPVLLEDADGNGVLAQGFVGAKPAGQITLSQLSDPSLALNAPLRLLFDLLSVSRGQTVENEILGSGNASIAGQEFVLQKAPLTYLPGVSASGADYQSTLRIRVDGIEWHETPGFYGQPPGAKLFVTREDEEGKTHVTFQTRLPTGANNIVASYRFGNGAETPVPGSLTVIAQPQPNLKAILAPALLQPGSDPDPPGKIRRYAPQSVLTFGRAVSADDYEAIAAQAPGVTRARSYWIWDETAQRAGVTFYVGDGSGAVAAARKAIAAAADPNRPVVIRAATAIPVALEFTLLVSPDYDLNSVQTNVLNALTDPETGLFGSRNIQIGQVVFESEIVAACLGVPGAIALHSVQFATPNGLESFARHEPEVGHFYQLAPDAVEIHSERASHA